MMRSMYSAVSGLKNHQVKMDVIGNNISNVNTVAFKAGRVIFQDIFSQTIKTASGSNANIGGTNPMQIGLGVTTGAIDTIFTDASAQRTDYALDLSIEGDGFFVVEKGSGETFFTRAGNFKLDNAGYLVTQNGLFVQDINGENISLGDNSYHDIAINSMGQLTGIDNGTGRQAIVATLGIATFTNPNGLMKAGNSLYTQTYSSGAPLTGTDEIINPVSGNINSFTTVYKGANRNGAGSINPGTLEMSNVDLSNEFTDMIVTQRGYQANARVITTADTLLEELVNLKR